MLLLRQSEGPKPDIKGVLMRNDELFGRLSHLKNNMQHLWGKFSDKDFELAKKKIADVTHRVQEKLHRLREHEVSPDDIHIDNYHYESHRMDDLPLTLNKDPGPGVKYSYTENSEFARGAEKTEAIGIDSFGEDDTYDPSIDENNFRKPYPSGLKSNKDDMH
jgi:hypothetical protein